MTAMETTYLLRVSDQEEESVDAGLEGCTVASGDVLLF